MKRTKPFCCMSECVVSSFFTHCRHLFLCLSPPILSPSLFTRVMHTIHTDEPIESVVYLLIFFFIRFVLGLHLVYTWFQSQRFLQTYSRIAFVCRSTLCIYNIYTENCVTVYCKSRIVPERNEIGAEREKKKKIDKNRRKLRFFSSYIFQATNSRNLFKFG